jgi:hypothetical protein
METELDVPAQVRELATGSIDNAEKAFGFFFDAATTSGAPASAESLALLKRFVALKIDYARKLAHAKNLSEATALQSAFLRAQIEITADLIRAASDPTD